ncbi:Holliday junction branch migration protein RuvA [Futiania mangrovi]|uniref:Holliday junction branch migration complex subunit RuvA n=1 Tax=Futiania mangrovi TaxID=2959716 RepID=A0A9J6PB37_9PROT|nr:Holliday junction branch migration protein RuvA [Futiania mangrovii]MCP1334888.1 Holliday junction branch migration protein RuvA [Futiania mangrovii]
MIGLLRGAIEAVDGDSVLIDVNGVGYIVHVSARTLQALPRTGAPATLFVETQVREDAITLYGFATQAEKAWFRKLTSVQGVGARVALAVLGTLRPDELTAAIALQDKTAVVRAPGVGPKLAQRIVNELKDKALPESLAALTRAPVPEGAGAPAPNAGDLDTEETARRDAMSALVNLGYALADANRAVLAAWGTGAREVDGLIRGALKELAR